MIINNINDKYLDKLNDNSQTQDDVNSQNYRILPVGKNGQGSFKLFYQRKNYEKALNNFLEERSISVSSFKDLIYSHSLYGKINNKKEVVIVKKQKLKQLVCEKKVTLINIVADAYDDLYKKHKSIVDRKQISTKSKFYDITPKVGHISANLEHSRYVNAYFNDFLNFAKAQATQDDIINLPSLIKNFVYFYNRETTSTLINKSTFISTTLCSPFSTGLMVQFTEDKHDDDKNKFEKYISDPSFVAFDNLVKEFGFVLDRHAPWRLVFDLASPTAEKYLSKYNITDIGQYFEEYYDMADKFDYDTLKVNLVNLYNFVANGQPEIKETKFKSKNNNICVSQKTITRKLLDIKNLNKEITEEEMIKLFFYFKSVENMLISSEQQYMDEVSEILSIYKFRNISECLKVISEKTKLNMGKGNKAFRIFLP